MQSGSEDSPQNTMGNDSGSGSTFRQWFVGYFLVALIGLMVNAYYRQEESREERDRINQSVEEARDAVRRGEAGEAFERLFPDDHEVFLDSQQDPHDRADAPQE